MQRLLAFFFFAVWFALGSTLSAQTADLSEAAERPPNILWIYIEDLSPLFGCYGSDVNAEHTPRVDQLAREGVRFSRAMAPHPVCSPLRSALMTGAMATSLGLHNHRSSRTPAGRIALPEGVQTLPQLLAAVGYRSFNRGKTDYNFDHDLAQLYPDADSSEPMFSLASFLEEGGHAWPQKGTPFFGQVQLRGGKHVYRKKDMAALLKQRTAVEEVEVPPYFPELPALRKAFAVHHDAARMTDLEVGALLDHLQERQLLDSTIVVLFSDHGMNESLRHKQFCYEGGVHVPLIVRFPAGAQHPLAGTVRDDLVSLLDVTATTLALAGVEAPSWMEGRNLFAADHVERTYVVSARDRCDYTIDRIRTVRTDRYRYIKNYLTDRPWMQPQYRDKWPMVQELRRLTSEGELDDLPGGFFRAERPLEELYDLESDPHQVVNLAQDPEHSEILAQHRAILEAWIEETGDRGQFPESDAGLQEVLDQWGAKCVNPEYEHLRR